MSVSIVIYASNTIYLDRTIDGIIDNTPPCLIKEIIVCNDGGSEYVRSGVNVITTSNVGRAKAWNNAVVQTTGDIIVFIKGITKFGVDWLQPIVEILNEEPSSLVTPVVHVLDTVLWSSEPNRWKRFGWRWDLEMYDRPCGSLPNSPAISSYCIAVKRDWFDTIGRFDDGMILGSGEDLELSIRNWLLGGHIFVADDSMIASAHEVDVGVGTINNYARIVEVWLQKYASLFYNLRGIKPTDVDTGRLNNLLQFRDKQVRSLESYLSTNLPELCGIYDLKGVAFGKRVAIIGPGSSIDFVDNGYINSFDIIIGVDYVAKLFECDYVLSDSTPVITDLRSKYSPNKFVLPLVIEDRAVGTNILTSEVMAEAYQFEYGVLGAVPIDANPPFCNFGNIILTAVHFALFLNPAKITLFGCDNKLIGSKSHTSKIDYYDDGMMWPDSDSTRRNFAYYEYCLDNLGKIGNMLGIPILRVTHA